MSRAREASGRAREDVLEAIRHEVAGANSGQVLQRCQWPITPEVERLYFQVVDGEAWLDETDLMLAPGSRVSFNTYFNSFYESYWQRYTIVNTVTLRVQAAGEFFIEIFRDTFLDGCECIVRKYFSNNGTTGTTEIEIAIPRLKFGEAGRIFFDVVARTECRISSSEYRASVPTRRVQLSIGICTYNREDYLLKTVQELLDAWREGQPIRKIIVVNQGQPFADGELRSALSTHCDLFTVIEQRNLGGAGGFTRTLLESLSGGEATHHVLMDDDIVLDRRALERSVAFLERAKEDIVIGGSMLDMMRPTILYEAGGIIDENNQLQALGHGSDLKDIHALRQFVGTRSVDYNAWWFCVLPLQAVRKVGLPLPVFLRGDDFEYGVRLGRAGVETVAVPGIAVWHEPFYCKPPGWQLFYDLRNRLAFGAVYAGRVRHVGSRWLMGTFLKSLCLHDYQYAKWIIMAVQGFLSGPKQSLGEESLVTHCAVLEVGRRMGPARIRREDGLRLAVLETADRRGIFPLRAMLALFGLASGLVLGGRGPYRGAMLERTATVENVRGGTYVLTNAMRSYFLRYERRRDLAVGLLVEGIPILLAYLFGRRGAAARWRSEISRFRDEMHWRALIGAPVHGANGEGRRERAA